MKTKKAKTGRQTRKTLRLQIIEHFDSQSRFAYQSGFDEAEISRFVNCVRDPNDEQATKLVKIFKMPAEKLLEKTEG